jgi:hypothetical protein
VLSSASQCEQRITGRPAGRSKPVILTLRMQARHMRS